MKTPFILLSALTLTLASAHTALALTEEQIDAKERAARMAKIERAWDKVEDGFEHVADAVTDFIGGVAGLARDGVHARPELQGNPVHGYLVAVRKGENVKIAYCRPVLGQIFHKIGNAKAKHNDRCEESLTKGSLNLKHLQACSNKHANESLAAQNLARELARVIERKEDYDYNYFGKWDSRENYRALFQQCAKEAAPRKAVAKVAPKKKAAPKSVVEVIDQQDVPAMPPAPPAPPVPVPTSDINLD